MDTLLKQMIEERDAAARQRDMFDAKVRTLNTLINDYQNSLGRASQADLFGRVMSRAERSEHVANMMSAAEELILAAKRPLTRSELQEALEARGYQVDGTDKAKVLGTNLWRSGRFRSIKGAGYWPKQSPLPAEYREFEERGSIIQ